MLFRNIVWIRYLVTLNQLSASHYRGSIRFWLRPKSTPTKLSIPIKFGARLLAVQLVRFSSCILIQRPASGDACIVESYFAKKLTRYLQRPFKSRQKLTREEKKGRWTKQWPLWPVNGKPRQKSWALLLCQTLSWKNLRWSWRGKKVAVAFRIICLRK